MRAGLDQQAVRMSVVTGVRCELFRLGVQAYNTAKPGVEAGNWVQPKGFLLYR
ncbi:MAG: hypothetical protein KTR25_14660 [Myxococcales bacterium]|nr:hypothetical protein [Myxococcales bacterium]